ncbi:MAG: GreA/GreB family elongation factor, partial [Oscillospiraceae bacterium]|nr:GreA/GreB family elongation factor [Oscillospiraceae bacterium]
VGSKVTVVDDFGDEEVYDIVGATEFDPFNNKISLESPIGAALVGHREGDEVEVSLPTGATMKLVVKTIA